MKKHTLRTILIVVTFLVAFYQIYPTFGWMLLSDDARQARLQKWADEDKVYKEPNYWREVWQSVKRWSEFDRDKVINLGLDLQGGIHMIVGLDMSSVDPDVIASKKEGGYSDADIVEEYRDQVLQTIRRRIAEFEAQEPIIQAKGKDQVEIQLPGEKDVSRARDIITRTAFLTFHMVAGRDETDKVFRAIEEKYPEQFVPFMNPPSELRNPYAPYQIPPENVEQVRATVKKAVDAGGIIPDDKIIAFSGEPKPWADNKVYHIYVLDKKAGMTGERLNLAVARPDTQHGPNQWMILFQLDPEGGRQFGELTSANINRAMAIVVDNVVESAPVIQSKITSDGQITGNFDMNEARDLSIALNSGAMPVRIKEDFTGVVGASLGTDSIQKGVFSAILGLAVVVLFMLLYYRLAGFVANIALFANAILIVAAMAYFNATLTLPGIAGLILTIGMAVDANVLIYERIREEICNGKSLVAAVNSGFDRATVTILDANVTTLIAAAVLMEFGTGPVAGFAVTLAIGVCASVFAALVVSRAIFDYCCGQKWFTKLTMMSLVKPDTKIRFMIQRRKAMLVSGIAIVIGVALFALRGENNFGVEFTTGTTMVVNLETAGEIDEGQVRTALGNAGYKDPSVTTFEQMDTESHNRFFIRLTEEVKAEQPPAAPADPNTEATAEKTDTAAGQTPSSAEQTASGGVEKALAGLCDKVVVEKADTVGPAVGKGLKIDAVLAVLYSFVFIIAYLWFRFEFKFSLGAVAALIHDVLITLGVFALLQRQISLAVVAAILTVIGYSLNDTIVVFDRVREDLRLYRGRGMSFLQLLDVSINQTLSRTILTSLTTLFVVVVLFFFGGEVIRDFALALMIGIVVGTYSSIFIASPITFYWEKRFGKQSLLVTAGEGRRASSAKRTETLSPLDVDADVDPDNASEEGGDDGAGSSKPQGSGRSKAYRRGGRR